MVDGLHVNLRDRRAVSAPGEEMENNGREIQSPHHSVQITV